MPISSKANGWPRKFPLRKPEPVATRYQGLQNEPPQPRGEVPNGDRVRPPPQANTRRVAPQGNNGPSGPSTPPSGCAACCLTGGLTSNLDRSPGNNFLHTGTCCKRKYKYYKDDRPRKCKRLWALLMGLLIGAAVLGAIIALAVIYSKDHCESGPCLNDGSCTSLPNDYSCACTSGWEGDNCEINVDECASSPCQNGGVCMDSVDGYNCTCTNGWTGDHCQEDFNDCLVMPCQHGGVCTDKFQGYTCSCVAGYTGASCETNINDCATNPCKNSGVCVDRVNSYKCTCATGWGGDDCSTNNNNCSPNPCSNGGVCVNGVNKYTCTCLAGYQGTDCKTEVNECTPAPCKNGGACTDLVNGYSCACVAGYVGLQCETDFNECASNPCQNGGMCHDAVNGYMCTCVAGYTGTLCGTDMDECASDPCQWQGTCADEVNGYTCTCRDGGFTGDDCEIPPDAIFLYDSVSFGGNVYWALGTENLPSLNWADSMEIIGPSAFAVYEFADQDQLNNRGMFCPGQYADLSTYLIGLNNIDSVEKLALACDNPTVPFSSVVVSDDTTACVQINVTCDAGYHLASTEDTFILAQCGTDDTNHRGKWDIDPFEDCVEIDECASTPCQNAGVCANNIDSFTCTCSGGWTGVTCEDDILECFSNPCKNGGVCVEDTNQYTCDCSATTFTGTHCET